MTDRATGSLIGERREDLSSPVPSGIYNLSATGNAQGDWPTAAGYHTYTNGTFPISNAQIQWMWQADGFSSSGLAANTATTPTNDYGLTFPHSAWISDYAVSRGSWTGSNGTTYYLTIPGDADFTLTNNSANGDLIQSNGGFTFWIVMEEAMYGQAWGRPWTYARLDSRSGSHTNGRNVSNTNAFEAPALLTNTQYNRFQFRRPARRNNTADYAYVDEANFDWNSNNILFAIWSQDVDSTTYSATSPVNNFYYYSKAKNGSVDDNVSGVLSFQAYPTYYGFSGSQVDVGKDFARPFFCDSNYNGNGATNIKIVTSGFANRPFTSSETSTFMTHLIGKYG